MTEFNDNLKQIAEGATWLVSEHHDGQRIDNFLIRECKGVPRQLIYRLLRTGKVRLNNSKARPKTKLVVGDTLRMPPVRRTVRNPVKPQLHNLPPVIFEDDNYVVFDKPAGVAVHGGSGVSFGLIEAARHMRDAMNLELGHRLDRDTSGLVVIVKTMPALRWFHAQLSSGKVKKDYVAVVVGRWHKKFATIDFALRKVVADRGGRRVVVVEDGLPSRTKTKCLNQRRLGALLGLRLETGRTHQARAHLAHVDLPILGDLRYGLWNVNRMARKAGFGRMFLHAQQLTFVPYQGTEPIVIDSKLPEHFADAIKFLDDKNIELTAEG